MLVACALVAPATLLTNSSLPGLRPGIQTSCSSTHACLLCNTGTSHLTIRISSHTYMGAICSAFPFSIHVVMQDELGIDMDDLVSPWQAAISSLVCFAIGGAVPLLSAIFLIDPKIRIIIVSIASTFALLLFGAIGAWLGGAHRVKAAFRVLLGGWIAFALTYGVGKLFGESAA
jgi:VIT1/CCC1 family predicted Fe2+/Mn2+ transporter